MNFELEPVLEAGRRFVELADEHAADFATRADEHDREGSFPFENFEAMRESGFLAATVPERFGGLGVDKLHDFGVGICRLSRGDGSTGIAARSWTASPTTPSHCSIRVASPGQGHERVGAWRISTRRKISWPRWMSTRRPSMWVRLASSPAPWSQTESDVAQTRWSSTKMPRLTWTAIRNSTIRPSSIFADGSPRALPHLRAAARCRICRTYCKYLGNVAGRVTQEGPYLAAQIRLCMERETRFELAETHST